MDCYTSLQDKALHFATCKTVNTIAEFETMIDELKSMKKAKELRTVFRGLPEAKFKLFTSLQREWLISGLSARFANPVDYINLMLDDLKLPSNDLKRYLGSMGVHPNDWLLLAFLQHYGAPSPLLDFTKDYIPALYFMCKGLKPTDSDKDIENYASIVGYNTVQVCDGCTQKLGTTAFELYTAQQPADSENFIKVELSFANIMKNRDIEIISVDDGKTRIKKTKQKTILEFPVGNLNMIKQEGEFVCNVNPHTPLEDLMVNTTGRRNSRLMFCYNIHKSLYEYILDKHLHGSMDFMTDYLFPSEYKIAEIAHKNALRKP